jgi:hypothetical protein
MTSANLPVGLRSDRLEASLSDWRCAGLPGAHFAHAPGFVPRGAQHLSFKSTSRRTAHERRTEQPGVELLRLLDVLELARSKIQNGSNSLAALLHPPPAAGVDE